MPIDRDQFRRVVDLELATSMDYPSGSQARDSIARVWLTCVRDGVRLYLEDAVTRKSMTRVVDVRQVDESSRTRLLALAVTELLEASWVELQLAERSLEPVGPRPAPSVEKSVSRFVETRAVHASKPERGNASPGRSDAAPAPRRPARPAPVEQPTATEEPDEPEPDEPEPDEPEPADPGSATPRGAAEWQLVAAFDLAWTRGQRGLMPGAELRGTYSPQSSLAFCLGVHASQGAVSSSLDGQRLPAIRLTTIAARTSVHYVVRLSDFDLALGAGARTGVAILETSRATTTLDPQRDMRPWLTPLALLQLTYRTSSPLRVQLEFEAGFLLRNVRAAIVEIDDAGAAPPVTRTVVDLHGFVGGASLGLGWAF